MAEKFMCVYSEMQALMNKFQSEAEDLNGCATQMQAFHNNTVKSSILEFKNKIKEFQDTIDSTETALKNETTRVCGNGHDGEGWIGDKSENFVNQVNDESNGLAGCFKTLRNDLEDISTQFTNLENKIGEVIASLKTNVETVSGFCTENAEFTQSMEEAANRIDS